MNALANIFTLTPAEQSFLDKLKYSMTFHVLSWGMIAVALIYTIKDKI